MYEIFKNRIAAGGYQLADIQHRMKKLYALGDLTAEELDELLALSQGNASADAERPETLRMLRELAGRVKNLEDKLKVQEDTDAGEEQAEYEDWTPWDGISDKYQYGAIVSRNGKLWISVFKGKNVWEPGTPGTEFMWVEYIPEEG